MPSFSSGGPERRGAFTLVELLVVMVILAILAALLLPALNKAKTRAKTIICLNNLRQMTAAWLMYAEENEDRLPPNEGYTYSIEQTWVRGILDPGGRQEWSDNTNTVFLRESHLGPYLGGSVAVWRCPADPSTSRHGGRIFPRVRSYSMNIYMGNPQPRETKRWRTYWRTTEIVKPPPSETFVLVDEREDSIEDGVFVVSNERNFGAGGDPLPIDIANVPRAAHSRAGTLSFADGHVEKHRWRDPRTLPPLRPGQYVELIRTADALRGKPDNPDAVWLKQRATALKR